jgi:hypothetical protein
MNCKFRERRYRLNRQNIVLLYTLLVLKLQSARSLNEREWCCSQNEGRKWNLLKIHIFLFLFVSQYKYILSPSTLKSLSSYYSIVK